MLVKIATTLGLTFTAKRVSPVDSERIYTEDASTETELVTVPNRPTAQAGTQTAPLPPPTPPTRTYAETAAQTIPLAPAKPKDTKGKGKATSNQPTPPQVHPDRAALIAGSTPPAKTTPVSTSPPPMLQQTKAAPPE